MPIYTVRGFILSVFFNQIKKSDPETTIMFHQIFQSSRNTYFLYKFRCNVSTFIMVLNSKFFKLNFVQSDSLKLQDWIGLCNLGLRLDILVLLK